MDQKNTIVKCHHADCLWQHDGVCNQYVISISEKGECEQYVECEKTSAPAELKSDLVYIEESQTCADCGHFDNTGLLQCWCKEIQHYAHRKANPCEAFVERKKYNEDIKPHKGKLNECWWCDYYKGQLSSNPKCQLLHPDIRDGKCHSIKSTGANQ